MKVQILGSRGIPARHGGFETFAESLALYLVGQGHDVTVYCQSESGTGDKSGDWFGVQRIVIEAPSDALGTMIFDLKATIHSLRLPGIPLILGYNTAILSFLYRMIGKPSLMNMDGIEWQREKWSSWERRWLRINEWCGAILSTHLIADHPEIARHLEKHVSPNKITTIPYGAVRVGEKPSDAYLPQQVKSGEFGLLIARPEPENSLLEIVQAFSACRRGYRLIVLGRMLPETNQYHRQVMEAASEEILFLGALYDRETVGALRIHAKWYVHGHRVGGTNPSLVEALAASSAIIAHNNEFNRWVAGSGAHYFTDQDSLCAWLCSHSKADLEQMRLASFQRFEEQFTSDRVEKAYDDLLSRFSAS